MYRVVKETGQKAPGYAVVWCPDFRLQAVVRRVNWREEPVALVDDGQRQSLVLARNVAAAREGVDVGMKTIQALARCSGLRVERPSASGELAAGRTLLETALGWVPGIEETEAGLLTLDLTTQVEEEWLESGRRTRGRLYDLGFEVAVGLGETPSLARIAALAAWQRGGSLWHLHRESRLEMLDGLPLTVAETGEELNERLRLWGIETLGAFARLSREAVASRLGEEGIELWLRSTGRLRRPLKLARLEQLFEEHHDFDYEVCDRESLLFVVNRFIENLSVRVERTGRAVIAVHLLLSYVDGGCYAKRLTLPEPLLDETVLFRLVSGHVETLEMKAAVEAVRLRFEPSDPVASQRQLFGAGLRNQFQFEETMKRLRRLVGADRVGAIREVDSHQPGAFRLVPLPAEVEEVKEHSGPPVTGLVLRRYVARIQAQVWVRAGRPVQVNSLMASGVVVNVSGPWRNEGVWWHRGREWERNEWDVELMKRGLFRLVECQGEWEVEGYYE